jgi:hypothetical protein
LAPEIRERGSELRPFSCSVADTKKRLPLRLGDGDAGTESILQVVKLAFVCSPGKCGLAIGRS